MSVDITTISTIFGALIWFLIGYWGKEPAESFDSGKVFKTIIAGLIVGILVVVFKLPETEALGVMGVLSKMGAIVLLERVYKNIFKPDK